MGRSQSLIKLKAQSLQHYCSQLLDPWHHTNQVCKLFLLFRPVKKMRAIIDLWKLLLKSTRSGQLLPWQQGICWKNSCDVFKPSIGIFSRTLDLCCTRVHVTSYKSYLLEKTGKGATTGLIINTIYFFHFTKKRTGTCSKVCLACFFANEYIFPITIVFCDVILLKTNHEHAPNMQ